MKVAYNALFWVLFCLHFKIAQFSKISTALYKPPIIETEDLLEYLLVIGTVDGNIHAIDDSLHKLWSTSTGSPLTFSATSTPGTEEPDNNNSHNDNDNQRKINSILPTLDGSLMFYTTEGMKRTPLKAKNMANMSPFISQEQMLFTGNRNSRLISVNMKDGTILQDVGHAANLMEARTLPGKEGLHAKPPLKKSTSTDLNAIFPFWFGRIDYTLQAIDMLSTNEGMGHTKPRPTSSQEHHIRYSEVYPLHTQSLPPSSSSSSGSSHHATIFDTDLQLYSTPEGYLYMFDTSGNLLHQDPIVLSSPAVDAYLVRLSAIDKSSSFVGHLPIEYGLNGLRFFYQMKMKELHKQAGETNDDRDRDGSNFKNSKSLALQPLTKRNTPPTHTSSRVKDSRHRGHVQDEVEEENDYGINDEEKMVLVQSITHEVSQQEHLYAMELAFSEDMMDYLYDSYHTNQQDSTVATQGIGSFPARERIAAGRVAEDTSGPALLPMSSDNDMVLDEEEQDINEQVQVIAPSVLPWLSANADALSSVSSNLLPSILTPPHNTSSLRSSTSKVVKPSITSPTVTHKLLKKQFSMKPSVTSTIKQSLKAFEDSFTAHLQYRNQPRDRDHLGFGLSKDVQMKGKGKEWEDVVVLEGMEEESSEYVDEAGEDRLDNKQVVPLQDKEEGQDDELEKEPLVRYTSSQHTIHSIHRLIPGYVDEDYFKPHLFPTNHLHPPVLDTPITGIHPIPQTPTIGATANPVLHPRTVLYWHMTVALVLGILLTSIAGYFAYSYQLFGLSLSKNTKSTSFAADSTTVGTVLETVKLPEEDAYGKILTRVGAMIVYNKILGYGSYGTIVYLGTLHGRFVAVKRMLSQLHKIADR